MSTQSSLCGVPELQLPGAVGVGTETAEDTPHDVALWRLLRSIELQHYAKELEAFGIKTEKDLAAVLSPDDLPPDLLGHVREKLMAHARSLAILEKSRMAAAAARAGSVGHQQPASAVGKRSSTDTICTMEPTDQGLHINKVFRDQLEA